MFTREQLQILPQSGCIPVTLINLRNYFCPNPEMKNLSAMVDFAMPDSWLLPSRPRGLAHATVGTAGLRIRLYRLCLGPLRYSLNLHNFIPKSFLGS